MNTEYTTTQEPLEYADQNPRSWIQALDQAGVDNWEGYDMAWDILKDEMRQNTIEIEE
jgi:hypothetical protein